MKSVQCLDLGFMQHLNISVSIMSFKRRQSPEVNIPAFFFYRRSDFSCCCFILDDLQETIVLPCKKWYSCFFPLKMSLDANSSEMSASKGFLQREMCGKWAVVPVQFVFLYWDLMGILWGIHVCISNYNHLGVSENGGFSPKLCQLMRKCWLTNWITSNTHRKESDVCNGM